MEKVLCLIVISRYGIPENEIILLLKTVGIEVNRLEWAHMMRSLKIFFSFDRFNNTQFVVLKNKHIRRVKKNYFDNSFMSLCKYLHNLSI